MWLLERGGEVGSSGGHAVNPVASVREDEKEVAADDADHEREALHDLVLLLLHAGRRQLRAPSRSAPCGTSPRPASASLSLHFSPSPFLFD